MRNPWSLVMTNLMEHTDEKWHGALSLHGCWSTVMTRAWNILMRSPWNILMTCVMELCDDKSMELCDNRVLGAL